MSGRSVETTNAWNPAELSWPRWGYEAKVQDIYRDYRQPPAHLSYRNKAERRKIHKHVYGDSWWVDLDGIEAEAAEILETDPAERRAVLRQPRRGRLGRMAAARAVGRAHMPDTSWLPNPPDGTEVCLGFDGSDVDDWTALRAETFEGFQFTPRFLGDRPTIWNPASITTTASPDPRSTPQSTRCSTGSG
jgi:hypothetical protein